MRRIEIHAMIQLINLTVRTAPTSVMLQRTAPCSLLRPRTLKGATSRCPLVVQMGRRSAKIAGRKVRARQTVSDDELLAGYLTARVATSFVSVRQTVCPNHIPY